MSDQYWDQTVTLLHCDGANGSTYVKDERHNVVTANGNAQISTAQSRFGGASVYFDGSGDYLYVPAYSGFNFGTEDFAVELWFMRTSGAGSTNALVVFDQTADTNRWSFFWRGSTNKLAIYNTQDSTFLEGTTTLQIGVWYHVAFVRHSNTFSIYLNGALEAAVANTRGITQSNIYIGQSSDGFEYFQGYMDEIRITKGVARYTGAFTPPAKAFPNSFQSDPYWENVSLLMPMAAAPGSTIFTDAKGHTVTNVGATDHVSTSAKFNGSSGKGYGVSTRYLSVAGGSDLQLGSGDFTIEGWFYITSGFSYLFTFESSAGGGFSFRAYSSANASEIVFAVGANVVTISGCYTLNTWGHLAFVRSNGSFRVYRNGNLIYSSALSWLLAAFSGNGTVFLLGSLASAGGNYNGYVSNFRVTKGVGRYIANFTVPSEPFPTTLPQRLAGVVLDAAGNPLARTVRSYRRDTGTLVDSVVSDPTTGVFQVRADSTDQHYVMVFDDEKNALVYDHVIPVL